MGAERPAGGSIDGRRFTMRDRPGGARMHLRLLNLRRYVLLALAVRLWATTAAAQGTFDYPTSADPEHLDPCRSPTTATRRVLINVYEGLTTLDGETAEVIPALATSWDISDDGLTYTFHLREGVLFHE